MVSSCITHFHCISQGLAVDSSFLTVLQIFSGFFFKLRKQAKAVQFLVRKYHSMVLFVILDIETTTRSCPGVAVPRDYQKKYEKYPLSINLASKLLFSWIVFAIIWKLETKKQDYKNHDPENNSPVVSPIIKY